MDTHPYYSFFPNSVINISYQITIALYVSETFYTPPTVCASYGIFPSELQLVYIFLARAEIHIQKFNFGQKMSNNYLVSFQKDQDAGCMFTLSHFSEPYAQLQTLKKCCFLTKQLKRSHIFLTVSYVLLLYKTYRISKHNRYSHTCYPQTMEKPTNQN
jgi:hypothetical protein